MIRHRHLEHRFVCNLPDALEPGVLFVSLEYGTAAHLCCCGCGEEIVTPITPTDWVMIYNGESVSLLPSIGNWMLPCRSHYVIDRGKVIEACAWTEEEVADELARDKAAKARYYGSAAAAGGPPEIEDPPLSPAVKYLWSRVSGWLREK